MNKTNHILAQHLENQGFQPANADELMRAPSEPFDPSKTQDTTAPSHASYVLQLIKRCCRAESKCDKLQDRNEYLQDRCDASDDWNHVVGFLILVCAVSFAIVAADCVMRWCGVVS